MDRGTPGRPAGGNDETVELEPTDDLAAAADDAALERPDGTLPAPVPATGPRAGPPAHWLAYIRARAPWLLAPGGPLARAGDGALAERAAGAAEPDVIPHGPTAHAEAWPDASATSTRAAADLGPAGLAAFASDEPGPAGASGSAAGHGAAPMSGHRDGPARDGVQVAANKTEIPARGRAGDMAWHQPDDPGSPTAAGAPARSDVSTGEVRAIEARPADPATPARATHLEPGAGRATPWPTLDAPAGAPDAVDPRPTAAEPLVPRRAVSDPAWPDRPDAAAPADRARLAPWGPASDGPPPSRHTPNPFTAPGTGATPPVAPPPASLPWPVAPGSARVPPAHRAARTEGWRVAATPPDTTMVARLALPAWPTLPDDPPEDGTDWRSIQRRLERSARLDREQRRR